MALMIFKYYLQGCLKWLCHRNDQKDNECESTLYIAKGYLSIREKIKIFFKSFVIWKNRMDGKQSSLTQTEEALKTKTR